MQAQASWSWNLRFDEAIQSIDFIRSEEDPCVYFKHSEEGNVFLVIYIDDILIMGTNISMLKSVKQWWSTTFAMKDLGEACYTLGIKIHRDRSKTMLGLSQTTYIDKILKRYKMEESKRGFLPVRHGISLSSKDSPATVEEVRYMSTVPYASAIGSIMYAMNCTRPDVSYTLSVTCRHQQSRGIKHWTAVKTILKYLQRTRDWWLVFGVEQELLMRGYSEAEFESDPDDYKSETGYVFTINGGAVSWKSCKQSTLADSTTESEYIAASEASKEAVRLSEFLTKLKVVPDCSPVVVYCDNSGDVSQAMEPRSTNKNKHICRKYHLIRDFIIRKSVRLDRVATADNVEDPLTKPLCVEKHKEHFRNVGVKPMSD